MKASEARKLSGAKENLELSTVICKIVKACEGGERSVSANPLSRKTIQGLKDLGYLVDLYYEGRQSSRPKYLISW